MGDVTSSAVTVILAIIGVALVAVLVSKNANTSGVLGATSSGLAGLIGAATAPLSGGGFTGGIPNVGSPIG